MSKKAVYQFLFYPELSDVEPLIWAMNACEWNWRISPLHDRDIKEDGTPKKSHYHILVGFSKDAPEYKRFRAALENLCNPGVAIPPARECLVHDPQAAVKYHQHEFNPDKAQYSIDDALESDCWNVLDYCTKEQKAEHKRAMRHVEKQSETECIGYCMDWLSTAGNPCELSCLLDHIRKEKPEFFLTALEKSYVLKSYADSKRHCERDTEVNELRAQNEQLQDELAKACDDMTRMLSASQSLQHLAKNSAI